MLLLFVYDHESQGVSYCLLPRGTATVCFSIPFFLLSKRSFAHLIVSAKYIFSPFLFSAGNLIFISVMKNNDISSYHRPINQPTYMCPHILCFCFWCSRGIILFSCLRLISLMPWSLPSWPPVIVPYHSSIIKMLPSLLDYSFFLFFLISPCSLWDVSSLTRDWTQALAVKVLRPNHWTARGYPGLLFKIFIELLDYSFKK